MKRIARAAVLATLFQGAGYAVAKAPAGAAHVVAAEREFAAYAAEHGWIAAFRTYAAPDGVVIADGRIRNARAVFNARADTGARAQMVARNRIDCAFGRSWLHDRPLYRR